MVVEHDLSVLDYLSDFICCLYGVPGAYGVVTMPFSVREGTVRERKREGGRTERERGGEEGERSSLVCASPLPPSLQESTSS